MRKHRSAEQWQHLVDQQRNSGLSVNDFCKWRKRLSDQLTSDSKRISADKTDFLDLSALMSSGAASRSGWHIVLSLGNGVELRLSQNG
jgi:putative transposase